MFIGREQELKKLNRMYRSDKPEVAVIYGSRFRKDEAVKDCSHSGGEKIPKPADRR